MGRFPSRLRSLINIYVIAIQLQLGVGFDPIAKESDVGGGVPGLVQDLGLDDLAEASKINVSQNEYIRMMGSYLQQLPHFDINHASNLITFDAEISMDYERSTPLTKLTFPTAEAAGAIMDVDQSELRMLLPKSSIEGAVRVMVYQSLDGPNDAPNDKRRGHRRRRRRRRLLDSRVAYLSTRGPKWCEFEVTRAVRGWTAGVERHLGLEVECPGCTDRFLAPLEAALNAIVYAGAARQKRGVHHAKKYYEEETEDCNADAKKRCCRHPMQVTFKALKVPQIRSIVQPKTYEAGFCKGRCPPNYNIATNHSRIQSLVHRLEKNAVPKVCCTPSKLAPLDILRVDPYDFTKLVVERWENMKVLECACS